MTTTFGGGRKGDTNLWKAPDHPRRGSGRATARHPGERRIRGWRYTGNPARPPRKQARGVIPRDHHRLEGKEKVGHIAKTMPELASRCIPKVSRGSSDSPSGVCRQGGASWVEAIARGAKNRLKGGGLVNVVEAQPQARDPVAEELPASSGLALPRARCLAC